MRGGAMVLLSVGLGLLPGLGQADAVEPIDGGEPTFAFDCTVPSQSLPEADAKALAGEIGRRWNLGMPSTDVLGSQVTVRVCFAQDGKPEQLILIAADGPSKEAVDQLFQAARRAVLRAWQSDGGLPLPSDRYDTWRVLDLVFDANGMRVR
jgi:hypothetical protein